MSSNHNHINHTMITRENYEEYFLLYIDDELTADQKAAVEAFAAAHPDLQAELEILGGTKFTPDEITLDGKEAFMAHSMQQSNFEETLLLYVDDELSEKENKEVKEKLAADASLQLQHQLLLKTKLDKTETIVYPNKEELYRKEERRIAYFWLRVAAAVVVITGAGAIAWFGGINNNDDITTRVALQSPPAVAQPSTTQTQNTIAKTSNTATEETTNTEATISYEVANKNTVTTPSEQKQHFKKPFTTQKDNDAVAVNNKTTTNVATTQQSNVTNNTTVTPNVAVIEPKLSQQQIINNNAVTNSNIQSYNSTEAASNETVPQYAAATTSNERSGSVKGFLRKATRFIERRANIKTVNADDELLIGAVAINLK